MQEEYRQKGISTKCLLIGINLSWVLFPFDIYEELK